MSRPFQIYPEYYIIKVNRFNDVAKGMDLLPKKQPPAGTLHRSGVGEGGNNP
ncbi:MAG: hypothetical protein IPN20_07070 [Haliscomenobacter sp.]|nr:hypothetical protein [Haliscomenobacter sp.]